MWPWRSKKAASSEKHYWVCGEWFGGDKSLYASVDGIMSESQFNDFICGVAKHFKVSIEEASRHFSRGEVYQIDCLRRIV